MAHSRHQNQWRLMRPNQVDNTNTHTNNNAKYIWLTLWMGHTNNPKVLWHSGSGDGMEKKKMDYQGAKWPSTEACPLLFSQTCTINTVTDFMLTSEAIPADTSSCRYLPKWTNIHLFPFGSLDFDTVNLMRTDRDEKFWHKLPLALSTIKKTSPGCYRGSKTLILHIHLAWMTAHPLRRVVDHTEPLNVWPTLRILLKDNGWKTSNTSLSPCYWLLSAPKMFCSLSNLHKKNLFSISLFFFTLKNSEWTCRDGSATKSTGCFFQRSWVWFLALPWRLTTLWTSGCRGSGGGFCGHRMYMAHRQTYIQAKHLYM